MTLNLLHAALRSHDPEVRAIAETIRIDAILEREIRVIESPDNFKLKTDKPNEESKEYRDYSTLLDLDFEPDQEYL